MIAGHTFAETHRGRACIDTVRDADGTERVCGRKWVDIRNATLADLNQPHIAHIGNTNHGEIGQIMAEREREDAVIREATRVAAGLGIGGMAAGTEPTEQEV